MPENRVDARAGTCRRLEPGDVRARLERDRVWAAFSLADLDPPHAQHAAWFGPADGHAVVLVFDGYQPPILLCHGSAAECDRTLGEPALAALTPVAHLEVTAEQLSIVARHFNSFEHRRMSRLVLDAGGLEPPGDVERLGLAQLSEIEELYGPEPPAFFRAAQLSEGVYYGVRERGRLVSIAGTHLVSARASTGAIGNVFTRSEARGRGLAGTATTAVCVELRRMGIATIVLNIIETNVAARRVYERIGFRDHCPYYEGLAIRSAGK